MSRARDRANGLGTVVVCTSSTRPTPAAGQFIYETDTLTALVYSGTAWEEIGSGDLATILTFMGA